jgi:hypothetical protein
MRKVKARRGWQLMLGMAYLFEGDLSWERQNGRSVLFFFSCICRGVSLFPHPLLLWEWEAGGAYEPRLATLPIPYALF